MKILVITNLFPNKKEPTRGVFNQQQILELAKLCELKVVAPVPWAPRLKIINKNWYAFSQVPRREEIKGIEIFHPRFFTIPKFGRSLYGLLFFFSLLNKVKEIYYGFKFDVIFATWAYPDGFGSFLISKVLKKSIVIKVHGTDINSHTKYLLRRKMIVYALKNSNRVITVSKALKERTVKIGVPENKIFVISNGIDTNLFKPMDKEKCQKNLGLPIEDKIILFVGNLKPVKGLFTLIDAFYQINKTKEQNYLLTIIGDGFLRERLENKIKQLKFKDKVRFVGARPHNEIPLWMNACDVFCLPSLNEGCPNVVLEALACGKPVVATKIGGISEIITSEDYGILVSSQDSEALAEAIQKALEKRWNPEVIYRGVSNRDWATNAKEVLKNITSAGE